MHRNNLYLLLIVLITISVFIGVNKIINNSNKKYNSKESAIINKSKEENNINIVSVKEGDVFSAVIERANLDKKIGYEIYESIKKTYDLADLKTGHDFSFYSNKNNQIEKIVYNINDEQELIITRDSEESSWVARIEKINYETQEKVIEGSVNNSLYQDALTLGTEDRVIMQFAENLEYSVDFSYEQRRGDKFKFMYEELYRNGKYVMPGRILAGAYLNEGKLHQFFYFEESAKNKGYFDENGNSVKKVFLKAPLAFKYISSPFTNGLRYVDAYEKATKHKAVDYASSYGTPIRAVGDGTVIFAGWSKVGYGNFTVIKHNNIYTTNYAHQSKILVKKGDHVKQGQIIGQVGSTGFSTGPHLHFEMEKNGTKIDPGKEILPPGEPINKDKMVNYLKVVEELKNKVKL